MNERASFLCDTAGNTVTVYIRGEIDHHTAISVRQGIDAILFEKKPKKLILDLSAVGFMDSSGLGLIMGRLSVMRELGGELVVSNPARQVRGILALAGMERMVRIEYAEGAEEGEISAPPSHTRTSPRQRMGAPKERRRKS